MNRRLTRSPDDRVLAGVAGGMAETYDMDPALVRVLWALLIIFTGGVFLLIYIVMALVVPLRGYGPTPHAGEPYAGQPYSGEPVGGEAAQAATDDTTAAGTPPPRAGQPGAQPAGIPPAYYARRAERRGSSDNTGPLILGALLVIVGGLFLARQFINIDIGQLWPVAVIALGLLLIVSAFARRRPASG